MEIILTEAVEHLGGVGDLVSVKPGYARNYLLPQHKAIRASKQAIAELEERRKELIANAAKKVRLAQQTADKAIKQIELTRQARENGKLYGSVKAKDIVDALLDSGIEINKSAVVITGNAIKDTGEYTVIIRLHAEVEFALQVIIIAER